MSPVRNKKNQKKIKTLTLAVIIVTVIVTVIGVDAAAAHRQIRVGDGHRLQIRAGEGRHRRGEKCLRREEIFACGPLKGSHVKICLFLHVRFSCAGILRIHSKNGRTIFLDAVSYGPSGI